MATGLQKTLTVIGLNEEVTEGTYVAPSSATAYYIQPLEDGFSLSPSRDTLSREILSTSIGGATPRLGIKSVKGSLPVEFRASGVEGAEPDFDLLLQSCFGARRQVASQFTTTTSNTTSVLNGTNIHTTFLTGDTIVILEAGSNTTHVVTGTPGTGQITYSPVRSVAPSDTVKVAKLTTYYTANSGHKALSLSYYWANEITEKAIGCKVTSLSVDNFQTGQVASLNFGIEGLDYDQINGGAPHTPTYDVGIPPIILSACAFKDGVEIQINNFSLKLDNTLSFEKSTCASSGKRKSRVTKREITGTINPYKDDTSVANFTNFNAGTTFSLFISAYNPSSVAGEISLGSVVGIYLPNCFTTELVVADEEGLLTDAISFQATTGVAGGSADIFLGMI